MVQTGPKWSKRVRNGPKQAEMVKIGPKWSKTGRNGKKRSKWSKTGQNGQKRSEMDLNGPCVPRATPKVPEFPRMVPQVVQVVLLSSARMVSNGSKRD